MSDNTEALRCADALERRGYASLTMQTRLTDREIAAHIRRLVAENEALRAKLSDANRQLDIAIGRNKTVRTLWQESEALNAELVEALKKIATMDYGNPYASDCSDAARVVLAKVEASNG